MLQFELTAGVKRPILLAGSFLILGLCPVCAQAAQTPKPRVSAANHSESVDATKIREDEARLLALLAKNPDDPGALAGMGWVRSRQKNYTAAVSYLERAKQKRPDDRKLAIALDEARYHVLLTEGRNALTANSPDSAQAFYSRALVIRPHSREALDGLHATTLQARAITHAAPAGTQAASSALAAPAQNSARDR